MSSANDSRLQPSGAPGDTAGAMFPVVGVGASAGGLDAFTQLLRHLPANTGMAYVLVQHLDPSHASHLVELLARVSQMPVVEVRSGLPLRPDHVYVIPPNTLLRIDKGELCLQPRSENQSLHLPIDFFFNSLAEDRGGQAIGVVLSGSGSDGTLGVQAIKGVGGIVFAQDETAQHSNMPRSAIDSGCVDYTLSPAEIAEQLAQLGRYAYLNGGTSAIALAESAADHDALQEVFRLLRNATRVDYSNYKRSTIMRRIQRRLFLLHLDRLQQYLAYIAEHPAEIAALHQDLLIHVTRFFRDSDVFDALAATVFPALMKDRPANLPIRIWVPGCSTGEEVYSLGIHLLEFLGDRADATPIKLFATDISAPILDKARSGKYPENISADVSAERLRRFFTKDEDGYHINKSVRDLCVFAQHDMTRDPPFSQLDLISCRNVLIYLGPALQKRVLPLFHYALKDRGFLMLGEAETIGAWPELFRVVDLHHKLYAKQAATGRLTFDFSAGEMLFGLPPSERPPVPDAISSRDIQREVDRAVLARYAPAGVVVNEELEIVQFRGQTGPYLSPAPGSASLSLLKMAREGLLLDLRSAIEEAKQSGASLRREGLSVQTADIHANVSVQVIPIVVAQRRYFAVLFEEGDSSAKAANGDGAPQVADSSVSPVDSERQLAHVRRELADTRDYLQSIIEKLEASNEELKAANEEIVSSNEELQITNEELQTSKEELQASNEELNTVNEELQHRNLESTQLSDDLTNVLRSVQIPIVMVGQDLRIRRFTPTAAELFSLIPSDAGRPIADLKPKLIGVDLKSRIIKVLDTLVSQEEDLQDEAGRWWHLNIRPYRTQQDRIEGAVISVNDIDALKHSELQIKQAREYAEGIISTVTVPLLVLDDELRVVSANRSFYEIFRTTAAEIEGQKLSELGARQWNDAALLELLAHAISANQPFADFLVERDLPGLGRRTMLLNGRRILRQEQAPPLILLAVEDVSDRRRMEMQLRQAQKMEAVGHLAAGIAHDFNNILTVINGYSYLLLDQLPPAGSNVEMLRQIGKAGERAATLTRQLLAFSRQQVIAPKIFDLNAIVAETELMFERLIGENIQLITLSDHHLGRVVADPSLIEQALLNLIINACQAMPQGGELTIETRNVDVTGSGNLSGNVNLPGSTDALHPEVPAGKYAYLAVRDTGTGMDQQTLSQVFEPFFTTKEVGKGTGLGLASVYGSIKQSGGFITVSSQLHKGTTFAIYLPRLPESTATDASPVSSTEFPQGTETILLVEDAEDVRRFASTVLKEAGYKVLESGNGAGALEVAKQHAGPIHLLATDMVMPKMGGTELADRLTLLRPEIKVLYLSGYTDDAIVRHGASQNRVAFLAKPYSPEMLAQKIREVLDAAKVE